MKFLGKTRKQERTKSTKLAKNPPPGVKEIKQHVERHQNNTCISFHSLCRSHFSKRQMRRHLYRPLWVVKCISDDDDDAKIHEN